jgi:mono/diheme cytochrome c family protein
MMNAFYSILFAGGGIALNLLLSSLTFGQTTTETAQQRWEREVRPILSKNCLNCHNESKTSGQLNLETLRGFVGNSLSGRIIDEKNSHESLLLKVLIPEAESHMPPEGQLSEAEIATIASFIEFLGTLPDLKAWQTSPQSSPEPVACTRRTCRLIW